MPVELPNNVARHAAELRNAEFAALRRTISARGTARVVIAALTAIAWAALTAVLVLFSDLPLAALLSLLVLIAGFEAVHALNAGVERIGRYLQVYYEGTPGGPQWETAAMGVGPALPGGGTDPLFSAVFAAALVLNLLSAVPVAPIWQEFALLSLVHAGVIIRIVRARSAAARQRAVELESFRALLLRERDRE
jgi:hypothetical protein